ncbi:hypothetical protein ACXR2U_05900 [Jatrophihabitans sp. YIM 134969]
MTSFAAPAPRAATGGPRDPSGLARLAAVVFWIVLPALCVTGIVLGVATWTEHAHRQVPGIPGTFLVDNRSCGGTVCLATGTFTSTDGNLVIGPLTGVAGWTQDSAHTVVYDPSTPDVIVPLPTRWNPTAAIASLTGATVLLLAWGWLAFGGRRPHPAPGPALA